MTAHRMNITLPKDLASLIKDKPNKSAYIAEALREKLALEQKAQRAAALGEAYRRASAEDRKETAEWDALAGDGL